MNEFLKIVGRDVNLQWREGNSSGMAIAFFLLTVSLFPLGVGPELEILSRISAGVLWVSVLLSALLSMERVFHSDFEDGTLDIIATSPIPLEIFALGKGLSHWIVTCLPIVIAAPFIAILMNIGDNGLIILVTAMLIGTPALSLFGTIGAALTISVKRGGVLISLLILPLYIPTLIFGVGAVDAILVGADIGPNLGFLGAISLFSVALSPFAAAASLKLAME
ncbi:MAG: heme exporter protein CcmB [Sphingomonadales bacterium]|jgi:heme exporter protein B